MTDLEKLAAFARIKAANPYEPLLERELWTQIADEIDGYLIHGEVKVGPGLFDD